MVSATHLIPQRIGSASQPDAWALPNGCNFTSHYALALARRRLAIPASPKAWLSNRDTEHFSFRSALAESMMVA